MSEWFREGKDENVTVEEFLEIFKNFEKSKKAQLLRIFVKNFRASYRKTIDKLSKANVNVRSKLVGKDEIDTVDSWGDQSSRAVSIIMQELEFIKEYIKNFRDYSADSVECLGNAMGIFMAVLDYGIVSTSMYRFSPQSANQIIGLCTQISNQLTIIDKETKHKYIRKRIEKIARKHAGYISDDQKLLIARISSLF